MRARWGGLRDLILGSCRFLNVGRSIVFTVLAVWLFFSPIYFSIGSPWVPFNYNSALVSLLFSVALITLYQYGYQRVLFSVVPGSLLICVFLFVFSTAWVFSGTLVFFVDRYIIIVCMMVLYLTASELYHKDTELFMRLLRIKLTVMLGVAVAFVAFIFFLQDSTLQHHVKREPPIYQDLRHFNYDLFFAIPVLVFLLKDNLKSFGWVLASFVLCVAAIWTAGRGMVLALVASYFVLRLRFWSWYPNQLEVMCFSILLCSLLVVIATGNTIFLYENLLKTAASDSLNQVSSNRINLWLACLDAYLQQDFLKQLFGLGPDAFARYGVWRAGPGQPHGSLPQFLIEFGAVGLILFITLSVSLVKKSLYLVFNSESDIDLLAASLLVGGIVFGLVDGIFYHTAPMVMMVLVISFIVFRYQSLSPAKINHCK